MIEPKTTTLLLFIILLLFLIFFPFSRKEQKKEGFSIKKNILSKTDIFAKHMLLRQF